LSLCLSNKEPGHKDAWGSGSITPPFLTSGLDGGEWLDSRPCRFSPEERGPGTRWIGRNEPWSRSERCEEDRNNLPLSGIETLHPLAIPTAVQCTWMNHKIITKKKKKDQGVHVWTRINWLRTGYSELLL
jgi:hypothetical protein